MIVLKILTVFICVILSVSESKFVETLAKCGINDGKCQADLTSSSLQYLAENGAPELDIPPIDPLEFKNVSLSIMDMINFTADNGKIKGLKNCVVDSVKNDVKKGHSQWKVTCTSLVIKVKYVMSGSNPLLKSLLGGDSIHGDGKSKMKFEKISFTFDFFYVIEKSSDGELYFSWTFDKMIYQYEVPGKVTFAADKIFIGKTEATSYVVDLLNTNANVIISSYGKLFLDKAMEFVYEYLHNFFNKTPIKYFIIDDLSEYVKN